MFNGNFRKRYKTVRFHEETFNVTASEESQIEARFGQKVLEGQVKQNKENEANRCFHKHTTLAIMSILASEALLRENKQ